jgi:hypothetical protein
MTDPIPPEAITAAAEYLHDDECNDGDMQTCGRWRCGSDPANQFHALHVQHVEYYRERATAVLDAASPVLRAADAETISRLKQRLEASWSREDKAGMDLIIMYGRTADLRAALARAEQIIENRDRYIEQLERQAAVRETTP